MTPGELVRQLAGAVVECCRAFPQEDRDPDTAGDDRFLRPSPEDCRLELVDHGDENLHHWEGDKFVRDGRKPHKRVTLFVNTYESRMSAEDLEAAKSKLALLGVDDVVLEEQPEPFNVTDW